MLHFSTSRRNAICRWAQKAVGITLAPEMQELSELTRQYYEKRDELKALSARIEACEQIVAELSSQLTLLGDKYKQLTARELVSLTDFGCAELYVE